MQLTGKGRKDRTVPLWPDTAHVLKASFRELGEPVSGMAFPMPGASPSRVMAWTICFKQSDPARDPCLPQPRHETHLAACHSPHDRHASAAEPGWISPRLRCGSVMKVSQQPTCISKPIWR